jgi:ABC-type nickel/cobalt efflux system permease component RcnA
VPSDASFSVLLTAAASIAFMHTVIGVDHTLPFVALGRARGWTLGRVLSVTALCGLGHVLSSLLLGAVGIGLGITLERLQWFQAFRGGLAAWLLIGFGTWLVVRALWRHQRRQVHVHSDGSVHSHPHGHEHAPHRDALHRGAQHPHGPASATTVWALFIVFAFGPCEPLIPLLMAPAAAHRWGQLLLMLLVFGGVTVGTMLALVTVGHLGMGSVSLRRFEPHADAIAGATIALSGVAVQALGI